ncbi:MAG: NAD-binding protein, partial [Stellaceae bacterium]
MTQTAAAEARDPGVIVIGDDALALAVAAEIVTLHGRRVCVLGHAPAEFARAVERIGARFVAGRPDGAEGLERAGVKEAATILALSRDDRLNLHAALRARDVNPQIRIVLRQLNRTLGRKIEQNLANCSVLSPTRHSAATYAAAGIDPACFHGVQFPEPEGPLAGFARRRAGECRVAGISVAEAERALSVRIIAVDGETGIARDRVLTARSELILFGETAALQGSAPQAPPRPGCSGARLRLRLRALRRQARRQIRHRVRRIDPVMTRVTLAALGVFVVATAYFRAVFGSDWLRAAYFVITTMTTTGYGDITPNPADPIETVAAMLLMLAGITFTGIFIASVVAVLTRIHWVTMQGLRPIRRRGHIVVCGAGNIGSGVIDLLLALDQRLVVI